MSFVVPTFLQSARVLSAMAILLIAAAAPIHADTPSTESQVRPDQVVDTLENTYGAHPGMRKNHAKGTCAALQFVGHVEAIKFWGCAAKDIQ